MRLPSPPNVNYQLFHFSFVCDQLFDDDGNENPELIPSIIEFLNNYPTIDRWIFQKELTPQKGFHLQGYLHLGPDKKYRKRADHLQRILEPRFLELGCRIRVQKSSTDGIEALRTYCMKTASRVEGPWADRPIYMGSDLNAVRNLPFPWQQRIRSMRLTVPDDTTIYHIHEPTGGVGKSKLTKFMTWTYKDCKEIPLGNATQLKTNVIRKGPARMYFIDIPRTTGTTEKEVDLYSAIEAVKNGYVSSGMYGKDEELYMDPPHVVVFSNKPPPIRRLSLHKWKCFTVGVDKTLCPWTPP